MLKKKKSPNKFDFMRFRRLSLVAAFIGLPDLFALDFVALERSFEDSASSSGEPGSERVIFFEEPAVGSPDTGAEPAVGLSDSRIGLVRSAERFVKTEQLTEKIRPKNAETDVRGMDSSTKVF